MAIATMKQSLLFFLSWSAFANANREQRHSNEARQLLLKKSNRSNANQSNATQDTSTNANANANTKEALDLQSCYYNLLSSSLYDGILSQSDFLTFVSLQSNGVGTTTLWNTPVTTFAQLSPRFVGVYNQYACGDALVACPSIEGVDVNGVYDLEDGLLGRICGSMARAAEEYSAEIGAWEGVDAGDVGGSGGAADDAATDGRDDEEDVSNETGEKVIAAKPVASKTGKVPNIYNTGIQPMSEMQTNRTIGTRPTTDFGFGYTYQKEGSGADWKVPLLACASVLVLVGGTIFAVLRKHHQRSENQLVELNASKEDVFIGELMENDSVTRKIHRNPFLDAPDLEQGAKSPSGSDAPPKPFSVFGMLRRNRRSKEKELVEPPATASGDDVFVGELMENDPVACKASRDRSAERGGTDSASGSEAPSNPFSVVSSTNTDSPSGYTTSSSPGQSSSESSASEDFASMVKNSNTNPFSLGSSCDSTPNDDTTPGKSPGGGSEDPLDKYVKSRLSLDNYDDWLSTVAESDDEFSKSDVSSLTEAAHDRAMPATGAFATSLERHAASPKGDASDGDGPKQSSADSQGSVESLEDLSSPLPPTPTMMSTIEETSYTESSDADESTMIDNDCASSLEVSTVASDVSFLERTKILSKMGAAFSLMKSARGTGKPRPFFEFATPYEQDQSESSSHLSNGSLEDIKKDIASAITDGDWTKVSATALLMAKADTSSAELQDEQCTVISGSTLGTHSQMQASELSKLVEQGDWEGIMKAAAQYEGASDTESCCDSNISALDDRSATGAMQTTSSYDSFDLSKLDLRSQVEHLVRQVVPEEIDNIDEMILQFSGREDELVETLRTMKEQRSKRISESL